MSKDPNFLAGAKLIYDRDLPFNFRYKERNGQYENLKSMELVNVKIFQWFHGNGGKVKIQLSSKQDIFFYYAHYVQPGNFEDIRIFNSLEKAEYKDYASLCIKIFNRVDTNPKRF